MACHNNCSGVGVCQDGTCYCPSGYQALTALSRDAPTSVLPTGFAMMDSVSAIRAGTVRIAVSEFARTNALDMEIACTESFANVRLATPGMIVAFPRARATVRSMGNVIMVLALATRVITESTARGERAPTIAVETVCVERDPAPVFQAGRARTVDRKTTRKPFIALSSAQTSARISAPLSMETRWLRVGPAIWTARLNASSSVLTR